MCLPCVSSAFPPSGSALVLLLYHQKMRKLRKLSERTCREVFSLNLKLHLMGLWCNNPRRNQGPRLKGKKEATRARLWGCVVCVPFHFSLWMRAGYSWTLCYKIPEDEPSGSLSQINSFNHHRSLQKYSFPHNVR